MKGNSMQKQVVFIFIAVVISAVLLAGCTQPQTPVQTPQPTTAISIPVQTTVAQPPVTVAVAAAPTTVANMTVINASVTQKAPATVATTIPPTTFDYSAYSSDSSGPTPTPPDPNVVKTDTGYVSGMQENGLRVYLGIPFAAPPTGDLRWRPPAPAQPWDGVKETKTFCAA